jgi:hypothetical protein
MSERRTTTTGGAAIPQEATDPRRSTTPQRDEAGTTIAAQDGGSETPYRNMKLPHERDESAAVEAHATRDPRGTRAVTRQGAQDVQSGQQDTDCYKASAPRYESRERKGK